MTWICEDTLCNALFTELPAADKRGNVWCPECRDVHARQRRLLLKCSRCSRPAITQLLCKPCANAAFHSGEIL